MSAEFFTERNENSIEFAVKNMQRTMDAFSDLTDYVAEVEETYARIPKGKDELRLMIRTAQCITNKPFNSLEDEVLVTYYGEIIGLEFINYLETDNGEYYKTGFAQSFMQLQIDIDKLTNYSADQKDVWVERISQSIQQDLSQPLETHGLNSLYEAFGQRAAERLTPNITHQKLAMMGYRMIVTEALKPSLNVPSEKKPQSSHTVKAKLGRQSIADLEKKYVPSVEETEAVLGDIEGVMLPEWEDISYIRQNIYTKYDQLVASDEERDEASNLSMLISAEGHMEDRLNKFTLENDLIRVDDLLSVSGEFFGISNEGREFQYGQFTEIRGVFDGLHIIEAPSEWDLDRVIDDETGEEANEAIHYTEETVALRLKDPKFLYEDNDGNKELHPNEDTEIYIPLHYQSVDFMRLKSDDLEPEA